MKDNSHKRRGNRQQQHDAYDYKNQWRSQDLRLGGARLKDNIKRKII